MYIQSLASVYFGPAPGYLQLSHRLIGSKLVLEPYTKRASSDGSDVQYTFPKILRLVLSTIIFEEHRDSISFSKAMGMGEDVLVFNAKASADPSKSCRPSNHKSKDSVVTV